jgi:serpin B
VPDVRLTIMLLAAAMALGASAAEPSRTSPPGPSMKTDQVFAWRLFQALTTRGNLFVSPESIRLALAMAAAGARGEMGAELHAALGLPAGAAGYAETASQLARWDALAHTQAPAGREALQLQVANRAWSQQGRHLNDAYVALLRDTFRSSVGPVDFDHQHEAARAEINRWVSDRTAGKIPALLAPGVVTPDTRLVLTNAIHFKATWASEFRPRDTSDAPFFVAERAEVRAPLMHQVANFRIASIEGGQLLELPYVNGDLAMDVILPERSRRLAEL